MLDSFFSMQLIIGAYDLGTPSRSANIDATVTLSVVRNLQTPYFLQSNYVTTIQENQATGTSILQVSARDDDTTVSFLTSSQRIKSIIVKKENISGLILILLLLLFGTKS